MEESGENKKAIITASEAARQLGCNAQKVREHMKSGIWPIGKVPDKKYGRYEVYQSLLDKLIRGEFVGEAK